LRIVNPNPPTGAFRSLEKKGKNPKSKALAAASGPATERFGSHTQPPLRQSLRMEDKTMRSAFDFAPFRRSTVGFDRLFDMLENSSAGQAQENYPPFDLIKKGDNDYCIELAVAGFKPDEIDITAQQNVLLVSGRKNDESEEKGSNYIYRGIATRSFERRFALADHIQVKGADMKDGLLSIELVREIPEAMKPRKIDIGGGQREERGAIGGGDKPAAKQTVDAEAEHA
jgi:molecular chaperone IbpA